MNTKAIYQFTDSMINLAVFYTCNDQIESVKKSMSPQHLADCEYGEVINSVYRHNSNLKFILKIDNDRHSDINYLYRIDLMNNEISIYENIGCEYIELKLIKNLDLGIFLAQ